jgi:hypothetical protein
MLLEMLHEISDRNWGRGRFPVLVDFDLEGGYGFSSGGRVGDLLGWAHDDSAVAPGTVLPRLAPSKFPDCGLTVTRSSYQASELHDFLLSDRQFIAWLSWRSIFGRIAGLNSAGYRFPAEMPKKRV